MSGVLTGRHIWYDLMSTDPEGAKEFYGRVVGWTLTPFEGGPGPYNMWTTAEGPVGGLVHLTADFQARGVPTHWLGYIATPDLDATVARAKELGAVLHHEEEIASVGRFAVLQDPWGAVFCAFTPEGDTPPRGRARPGEFSWHELMSDDYDKAFDFYADLFGWERGDAVDMGDAGIYQLFRRPGEEMDDGGIMNRPPEAPGSAWLYYMNVADLETAVATVGTEGGQVLHGPMEVPGGDQICVCLDPQGGAFALHQFAAS